MKIASYVVKFETLPEHRWELLQDLGVEYASDVEQMLNGKSERLNVYLNRLQQLDEIQTVACWLEIAGGNPMATVPSLYPNHSPNPIYIHMGVMMHDIEQYYRMEIENVLERWMREVAPAMSEVSRILGVLEDDMEDRWRSMAETKRAHLRVIGVNDVVPVIRHRLIYDPTAAYTDLLQKVDWLKQVHMIGEDSRKALHGAVEELHQAMQSGGWISPL